jgi:uncharacterized repeat protein (TIGR01451 family)
MHVKRSLLLLVFALVLAGLDSAPLRAAAIKADYQFQNSRASSVGSPPQLVDSGATPNSFVSDQINGVLRTALAFASGSGLTLAPTTGVVPNDRYSIILWFRLSQVDNYRKLIDFANGSSEAGLYVRDGRLVYYGEASTLAAGTATPIAANTYVQVALTRDASRNVAGYVDGVLQFSFVDSADRATIDARNTLRFFRDDTVTMVEQAGGVVARIRLYDDALSAAEIASLAEAATASATTADLGVTMADAPDPVVAGQTITYTISVVNAGPGAALSAALSDTIPAGVAFQSLSPAAGWTCPTVPAVGGTGAISCLTGSIPPNTTAPFTLTVLVPVATIGGTTVANTVNVSSGTPDANTANNSATTLTTVIGAAPTATPTPTAAPTLAVTATQTATTPTTVAPTATVGLSGRWLDKPPTAKVPSAYCPTSGVWPVLYWGGADGVPIAQAAAVCPSATTFWVRRNERWLGYSTVATGSSDTWTVMHGEGYFVGVAAR